MTAEGQTAMLTHPDTDPAGAVNADVTIVEYFDYNCPYCKKMAAVLQDVLAKDRKLRVLYKEWPVLGETSVYAARAALAAKWQHKYLLVHDGLIKGPRLATPAQVDQAIGGLGVDLETLSRDRTQHSNEIDAILARDDEEARALELRGTPGLVVGRELVPGVMDAAELERLIADARGGQ